MQWHITLPRRNTFFTVYLSIRWRKLTLPGGFAAAAVGLLVFAAAGYTGLGMLAAFFIMATIATSFKKDFKQTIDPSSQQVGGRTAGQVMANGGIGATLALLSILFPANKTTFLLMMAASFSAATADTLSSEIGMVWGRRFYNVISLKEDRRGLNGVVSVEGTIAGFAGSCVMATLFAVGYGFEAVRFAAIIIAGTAGNVADSLLGATLERNKVLNNDAVNALNTLIAALVILLF